MRFTLANDANGNPIDVPENATAWRVRRAPVGTGRPQNVYDPETGRQLEIALDSTIEDLRACGCGAGRYRLEAVDADSKAIAGVTAFTELAVEDERPDESELPETTARLLETIEKQSDVLCKSLEALAHAFGPVRPWGGETPSSIAPAAPPPASDFKTEKLVEMVGAVANAFKTGVAQGVASAS